MSPEISERSFEEAIECGLLQHGPDACGGDAKVVRETTPPYGDTPPGGYRKRMPEDYDRALCLLPATWWISSSPPSRRSGRSSSSTMARR